MFIITDNYVFLSVLTEKKIYKASLPPNEGTFEFEKVIDTGDLPRQVSYDPVEKKIYWVEYGSNLLRRCDLDGGGVQDFSTTFGKFWMYFFF